MRQTALSCEALDPLCQRQVGSLPCVSVLYLICGAAPPTLDIGRVVPLMIERGWDAWVIPTPHAAPFLGAAMVEAQTGHPPRTTFRMPGEARMPSPAAVLAAPMTFNSVNKWAAGIADTFALAVLTEALGEHRPVVVVPWAKPALTSHPAFDRSVQLLRDQGATVVLDRESAPLVPGAEVPDFPWRAALAALPTLTK
jgi:phosphopantothenoylcysteine decarboxylase